MRKIADGECFATLAPPKPEPVLREAWVWWNSHGKATLSLNEEWCVHQRTVERGVYARVAVMSDGSPVSGEGHTNCWANYNLMTADRDAWRSKAEALNRDLDSRIAECGSAWEKCDEWRTKAEALQAEVDDWKRKAMERGDMLYRQAPVVDAAVAFCSATDAIPLRKIVRTYQSQPKKSTAEAVANVAEMNCTTCRWFNSGFLPPSCKSCSVRGGGLQMNWEPRHD